VYVATANGTGFNAKSATPWISDFCVNKQYSSQNTFPRMVADINYTYNTATKDSAADMIGFANDGVWVALSTKSNFAGKQRLLQDFGTTQGWTSQEKHPRFMADVNGDKRADIVGFWNDGVYVATAFSAAEGVGFHAKQRWIADFGVNNGWGSQNTVPRMLADVNGDGYADIVAFANDGVYVALSNGVNGFGKKQRWIADFGYNAGGWSTQDKFPRMMADVNGDGKADIVGLGQSLTVVGLNNYPLAQTFEPGICWTFSFTVNDTWSSFNTYPKYAVKAIGKDSKPDIVGFGKAGVYVLKNTTF
jgi:hypothetical protein